MLDVLSPSLPPTTYSLLSITATPNCSRRPFITPTWTQVFVRRSYFSMVVEPKNTDTKSVTIQINHADVCCYLLEMGHTFGGIHPSYSVKCTHSGLSRFGSRALKHGAAFRQKMVLHGLHQQLLAFQIIREHLVVFQICKELHYKKSISRFYCFIVYTKNFRRDAMNCPLI